MANPDGVRALRRWKAAHVADLDAKREKKDWHGVRDACVDIEKIDAVLEILGVPPDAPA